MNYKNTQFSPLFFSVALIMTSFFGFLYVYKGINMPFATILQFIVIFILFSFSFLTTMVLDTKLKIRFGKGIYRKTIDIGNIKSVNIVRNKWYYGWGVRYRYKPSITIFNIFGLNAVEIVDGKGNIYRIGTNEPEELKEAINKSINNLKKDT